MPGDPVNRDEIIPGIVIFIFGAITVFFSLKMPLGTFRMAGTGMFPLCLGILLMILSGIFILKIFSPAKKEQGNKQTPVESSESPIQMGLFFGAMVLAALFFNQLGYPLTSLLLMLALLKILGIKSWVQNVLVSVVSAAGSYILFVKWLDIPMPKGWIGL